MVCHARNFDWELLDNPLEVGLSSLRVQAPQESVEVPYVVELLKMLSVQLKLEQLLEEDEFDQDEAFSD